MSMTSGSAVWSGGIKDGKGAISTKSGALKDYPYGFSSRFEGKPGTNPEELLAAAHAGCYTMKLSFVLGAAGLTPENLETRCDITLDNGVITKSELTVTGKVPGATNEQFQKAVADAHEGCLVGKLFNCEKTVVSATLS